MKLRPILLVGMLFVFLHISAVEKPIPSDATVL